MKWRVFCSIILTDHWIETKCHDNRCMQAQLSGLFSLCFCISLYQENILLLFISTYRILMGLFLNWQIHHFPPYIYIYITFSIPCNSWVSTYYFVIWDWDCLIDGPKVKFCLAINRWRQWKTSRRKVPNRSLQLKTLGRSRCLKLRGHVKYI